MLDKLHVTLHNISTDTYFLLFTDKIELGLQDLEWLITNLEEMAPGWFFFGLRLKVEYIRLEIIKKNNPSDCVACLRETLVCWLNQNPNAGQLVKALEENKKLLKHIKQSLSQCDHRKGSVGGGY